MIVSVDGDILLYRVGFACQETRIIERNGKYVRQVKADPVQNAFHSCKLQLEAIREMTKADRMDIYLTGENNFRKDVSKFLPYKGSRFTRKQREELRKTGRFPYFFDAFKSPGPPKPKLYPDIRQYLIDHWGAKIVDGMEADDACTINQTLCREKGDDHCIATIDKDLMQVPGKFLDFRPDAQRKKGKKQKVLVTHEEAELNLWCQALTGDRTDTIYGINGIGDVKAKKLLKDVDPKKYRSTVVSEYRKWFKSIKESDSISPINQALIEQYDDPEEYMEEVYQLVYLLRWDDEVPIPE